MTLEAVIQKDLCFLNIREDDALDRAQWKIQIYVADHNGLGLKALFVWSGLVWFGLGGPGVMSSS